MKRIGGIRRGTRHKYKKNIKERGKISSSRMLAEFKEGEKVALAVQSDYHKGMYHPRFFGKMGVVKGKKGKCYEVAIKDQNKAKMLIVHPVHLRRA